MTIAVCIWFVLVMIGVFDAREHRIPNHLVITLLILATYEIFISYPFLTFFDILKESTINLFICFLISLVAYIFGIMAAGDVKLISVIGFIVGQGSLVNYFQFTSWACVCIGIMYLLLNKLASNNFFSLSFFTIGFGSTNNILKSNTSIIFKETMYMPFAPVLVIGLAMYQFSLFR